MKKLIVFSVVFALVAGGLFAADVGLSVFGHVNVLQTGGDQVKNDKGDGDEAEHITSSGGFDRLRIDGSGENGDSTFGAYWRLDGVHWALNTSYGGPGHVDGATFEGTAWWKPIDQFKMTIGKFRDGALGKEGVAGWMFYQMPSDAGMVQPADVWGGGYYPNGRLGTNYTYRSAFFGGYEIDGLLMEIAPIDMLSINVGLPFFNGGELVDVLKQVMAQVSLNLDFGNIALTYWGAHGKAGFEIPISADKNLFLGMYDEDGKAIDAPGTLYLSTSITAVENLGIDFGFGFTMPVSGKYIGATYDWDGDEDTDDDFALLPGFEDLTYQAPIQIGLGAKYDVNEAFGIKARVLMAFGEKMSAKGYKDSNGDTFFGVDLLPYYAISDNVKAFFGLGMNILSFDSDRKGADSKGKEIDSIFGWFINPYVQIGAEWGPCIYFGVRVWSDGVTKNSPVKADQYTPVHFELPIGVQMSF